MPRAAGNRRCTAAQQHDLTRSFCPPHPIPATAAALAFFADSFLLAAEAAASAAAAAACASWGRAAEHRRESWKG